MYLKLSHSSHFAIKNVCFLSILVQLLILFLHTLCRSFCIFIHYICFSFYRQKYMTLFPVQMINVKLIGCSEKNGFLACYFFFPHVVFLFSSRGSKNEPYTYYIIYTCARAKVHTRTKDNNLPPITFLYP